MAGAMRKMGIYLGLVEDDDARTAYGRYDARQSGYDDDARDERRSGDRRDRYGYDDAYAEPEYPSTEFSEEVPVEELAVSEPAPVLPRRTSARRLDLAPATGLGSPSAPRIGSAVASGPVAATAVSVAVREPVVAAQQAPAQAPPAAKPYRITTLHPRTYNEARTIGERFRDGQPVIMNLTEMDDQDAKRLVDFAAGLSFGLHGSIERVTAKVFLLSPRGTDVTAEDKARIREVGFFNQS
ncbi:cell division protein SepF [Modestobacter sp. Leaf380]|uniref:cell division protein SepF n=1 Tax=Modestobacter sp. Leaf380 TaxID=1736356 RepID=UPI0006FF4203|nr:cell division protein SepF [Modestobacter sp. Leaf380]KQS64859.1 hypothetical protein ASG41_15495 [Modestobacter sp. Leaf380]